MEIMATVVESDGMSNLVPSLSCCKGSLNLQWMSLHGNLFQILKISFSQYQGQVEV